MILAASFTAGVGESGLSDRRTRVEGLGNLEELHIPFVPVVPGLQIRHKS